jgi:hypothetical protein
VLKLKKNDNALDAARRAAAEAQEAVAELERIEHEERLRAAQEPRRQAALAAWEREQRSAANVTVDRTATELERIVAALQLADEGQRARFLEQVRALVAAATRGES